MDWRRNDRLGRRGSVSRIWKQGWQILRAIWANTNADANTHSYGNANAVHGAMHTNAKAAIYSLAAALTYSLTRL
jgi:hypothetical protein